MNDRQKRAATAISLAFVCARALFMMWLAVTVLSGSVRGDKEPARLFMLLIADWNTASGAFKSLPVLVSVGLAGFGTYKMKDWLFHAMVILSFLGLIASGYLLFETTSVSTAKDFWEYSPTNSLDDYETFVAAAKVALGVFCGWFIIVLATELGVRIGSDK